MQSPAGPLKTTSEKPQLGGVVELLQKNWMAQPLLSVPYHPLVFQTSGYVPSIPQLPLPLMVRWSVFGSPLGQHGVCPQPPTVTFAVQLVEAKSVSDGVKVAEIVCVEAGVHVADQVQLTDCQFWLVRFVDGKLCEQSCVPSTAITTVPCGAAPAVVLPSLLVTRTVIVTVSPLLGLAGLRLIEQLVLQLPQLAGGATRV